MSNQYIGEIRMVSFNFAPRGWALANGQTLPINQNQALFALYGGTYGSSGQTFNLPNLQGRSALHFGTNPLTNGSYAVGAQGGEALHALTANEIPAHNHTANVSTLGGVRVPTNTSLPGTNSEAIYTANTTATTTMGSTAIANAGGGAGHENRMPYLVINFIVALTGVYPARS